MRMKSSLIRLFIISCIFVLTSCANIDTVANAPTNTGIAHRFSNNHKLVKAAILASVQNLNINIKQTKQTPEGFTILFTKSMSPFSWGEVGRVLVSKADESNTLVYVHSEKKAQYQITGTNEKDLASPVFKGLIEILEKRNK